MKCMATELQSVSAHCWSAVSKSGDSRRKYIWKIWLFRCTDALLALDTFVELYNGGIIRLSEFVNRKKDKDLLLSIIKEKAGKIIGTGLYQVEALQKDSVTLSNIEFPYKKIIIDRIFLFKIDYSLFLIITLM